MMEVLHREHAFCDMFVAYLLDRNIRYEEDLVDQLFNSSEKRLARMPLLLAHFAKDGKPESVIPKISQETLAEMIGTTRSRVSFFINRFRKLGFIDYHAGDELQVHSSLLNVVLHDYNSILRSVLLIPFRPSRLRHFLDDFGKGRLAGHFLVSLPPESLNVTQSCASRSNDRCQAGQAAARSLLLRPINPEI
jgi:hypothetical protein